MRWYWGVMDFFFVMSGFLITRSLISNCDKGRGTPSFLLYRALRLLPAYMMIMLVYELLVLLVLRHRDSFETLPYVLFYQNTDLIFSTVQKFPRVPEMIPYWSLVLEEQFYLLWGIFFCKFAYAKLRINLVTLASVVFLLGLGMLWRKLGVGGWTLPGRFDGFLLGSMASIIIFMPRKWEIPKRWTNWLLRIGCLLSIAAAVRLGWSIMLHYRPYYPYLQGFWIDVTCFSIISVVLVLGMVKIDIQRIHFGRLQDGLAFLGLISYEIYLVHFPIIAILKSAFNFDFNNGGITLFFITMTLSSVIAHVIHKLLTAPALKSRERVHAYFTSRFRPAAVFAVAEPGTAMDHEAALAPIAAEDRIGGEGR